MKTRILITLYSLLLCFSCNDFLDVEPDEQISLNQQLSTKQGVLEAYIGIYTNIESLLSSSFQIYGDLQGGNITFTPSESSHILDVPSAISNSYSFSDEYNASEYDGFYSEYYEIINQVNTILDFYNSFDFFSSEEANQLQAELLTIRAFAHYQIAIHYAQNYNYSSDASHLGIVYNTSVIIAGIDFPSRKTLAETYELLKTDLNEAINLYTNAQLLPAESYSYFNINNTQALYARIALQMNDWQLAHNLANTVISESGIILTSQENYISEWIEDLIPINEVLLEFTAPRSDGDGTVSSSISSNYNFSDANDYQEYVASGDLLTLYDSSDIRKDLFFEEELTTLQFGVENQLPYYFTNKFQGNAGTLYMRLSEMYLIRAEASERLGNSAPALSDLNIIRTRAGLEEITVTTDLLEEIFEERRRELAFEGHLFFDIIRFNKDVIRNEGCLANVCNLNYPSNYFVLPIPASSADLNENIKQNEGY